MIDAYLFVLFLGFGGLSLMALLGLGHQHSHGGSHALGGHHSHGGSGSSHGGAHSCGGHHHASAHAVAHQAGHGHGGHAHSVKLHSQGGSSGMAAVLTLLSPRVAFTLLMGFGAAGVLLRPMMTTPWLLFALAALGAVAFEWLIVSRLWKFLFRFASDPARTLDSVVLEEGCAVTNFDGAGQGLISLHLDGQFRQILGTLCAEDRSTGCRVRTGDRLFIQSVDPRRNTCTVSLLR